MTVSQLPMQKIPLTPAPDHIVPCMRPNARGEQRPTLADTGTSRKELAGRAVCSSAKLGLAWAICSAPMPHGARTTNLLLKPYPGKTPAACKRKTWSWDDISFVKPSLVKTARELPLYRTQLCVKIPENCFHQFKNCLCKSVNLTDDIVHDERLGRRAKIRMQIGDPTFRTSERQLTIFQ